MNEEFEFRLSNKKKSSDDAFDENGEKGYQDLFSPEETVPSAAESAPNGIRPMETGAEEDTELNIQHYVDIILRRNRIVLFTTALILVLNMFWYYTKPLTYSTTLIVQKKDAYAVGRRLSGIFQDDDWGTVIQSIGLKSNVDFSNALKNALIQNSEASVVIPEEREALQKINALSPDEKKQLLEFVLRPHMVNIQGISDSNLIEIRLLVEGSQLGESTTTILPVAADLIAAGFIRSKYEQRQQVLREFEAEVNTDKKNMESLEHEIAQVRVELNSKFEKIAEFSSIDQLNETLKRTEQLLFNARMEYKVAKSKVETLKRELESNADNELDMDSETALALLKERLVELEIEKTEALVKYTDKHHSVKKIQESIDSVKKLLATKLTKRGTNGSMGVNFRILSMAMVEQMTLNMRLQRLEEKVNEMRIYLQSIEKTELYSKYNRLKVKKDLAEKRWKSLTDQLETARLLASPRFLSLKVKQWAGPTREIHHPWTTVIILALVVGVFSGCMIAFLIEHMDDTFKSPDEIAKELNMKTLGMVPMFGPGNRSLIDPDKPKAVISDVFAVIRNNIRYSIRNRNEGLILVASALPAEGKSLTAYNLARSYQLEGKKVVLVNCDLRKQNIPEFVRDVIPQEENVETGLSDFIEDLAGFDDIVIRSEDDDFCFVSSGTRPANPVKLLRSPKLNTCLKMLEEAFDVVILDSPAVLPVVDTTMISNYVSAVVVIVESERTPRGAVVQAIDRLRHVNSPIIGVLLNKVKDSKGKRAFYGYGYGYRYPYGAKTET